jgi:hypothetical protein
VNSSTPPLASLGRTVPPLPPPDTPEGRVLIFALLAGTGYTLLLVADAASLADQVAAFITLPLILGTIATFATGGLLSAEYGRIRTVELELAKATAQPYGAGRTPTADSRLGSVWREYLRTADQMRRSARSLAYAAGPLLWGTLLALGSAISWGFDVGSGAIWPTYLALIGEIPALTFLTLGVAILATGVGSSRGFAVLGVLTPQRWKRWSDRVAAVDEAVQSIPWLEVFAQTLREQGEITGDASAAHAPAAGSPSPA